MSQKSHIPKIPHRFFKWYCEAARYEELHGDLEEFFYERVEELGVRKAKKLYWFDVIRCCRPYAWKKNKGYSNSQIIMFKNYFKTSLRAMVRNPLSSFINVFGLAVAIGVSIVVYSMLEFSYSTDQFHSQKNEVFLTTFTADRDGVPQRYGFMPAPIGERLQEDIPQVIRAARVEDRGVVIKQGDQVFHERLRFTDPDFLKMLSFPLKWGSIEGLSDRNGIILSDNMAQKYFGLENPLGQEILVIASGETRKTFTVRGVAEKFPAASSISFNFLVNFDNLKVLQPAFDSNDWSTFLDGLLVQTDRASDHVRVRQSMQQYKELFAAVESDWVISDYGLEPLASLHINGASISNDISTDLPDEIVFGLPVMGGLIVILACFNYMNMSIGASTKRLKEIGVRKVIGANRNKVMIQFLAENVFVTFFALFLGLFLAATLFLPWFGDIADTPLSLNLVNGGLWSFLIITVLLTGVISGFYPALYVSRFQVVNIFKGTVRFGKKSPMMKGLLALQMVLAFVFITMAVMFKQNSDFQAKRPWGYDQNGVLYVNALEASAYEQLHAAMTQVPGIETISGAKNHVGRQVERTRVQLAERAVEVNKLLVEENYFETLGIPLQSGAFFRKQSGDTRQVVVNELFVENALLEAPVGEFIKLDSVQYQIVGVVQDFHSDNFFASVKPMVFFPADKSNFRFMAMRVRDGSELEVLEALQTEWAELFPEIPFVGGLQVDLWADFYLSLNKMKYFTRTVALVAVLVAALGLYGLVMLNVSGRVKEFSIRKILGAGWLNLGRSIVRQYLLLTLAALLIGAPVAYLLNIGLMNLMFAYPLPNAQWSVGFAFVLLIVVMLMVIATQVRRVSVSNPAEGLRTE